MKKVVLIILVYFIGMFNVYAETTSRKVDFVRCVDGDTAVFKVDDEEVKFRFLAIDTPETVHPTKDVEAFGKNASEYTCNRLTNATEIIVEYENSNRTDKYGRSLGWIWIDGSLLQKDLINIGYAQVAYIYGKYRYTESLCLVQKNAKQEKLGLWNDVKEEGYCSTIDTTSIEDNIIYDNINKQETSLTKEEEKLSNILQDIDNVTEKVSEFTSENSELVSDVYFYIIIGAAILSIIIKQTKK